MPDIKFIDGLIVKEPNANAPDYIIAKLSLKREDLIRWLQGESGDWINAEIKVSQAGKWYCAVDEWKPDRERQAPAPQRAAAPQRQQAAPAPTTRGDFADDDIPF